MPCNAGVENGYALGRESPRPQRRPSREQELEIELCEARSVIWRMATLPQDADADTALRIRVDRQLDEHKVHRLEEKAIAIQYWAQQIGKDSNAEKRLKELLDIDENDDRFWDRESGIFQLSK